MKSARIPATWSFAPLIAWAVTAGIAAVVLWNAGGFRSDLDARQRYDSGTRAAMAGDLPRAVIELRAAQRFTPGLLPMRGSLAARIDGNLAEVRARVAVTPPASVASDAPARTIAASSGGASAKPLRLEAERSVGDRALAAVRSVPTAMRAYAAAVLLGLAAAFAAVRQFRAAAACPVWPGRAAVAVSMLLAFCAAGVAVVDRVLDARHVEAVLIRAEVPRTGPDDLLYPPAAAAAFPAGSELVIRAESQDRRWVRAGRPTRAAASEGGGEPGFWFPRSAVEIIGSDRPDSQR